MNAHLRSTTVPIAALFALALPPPSRAATYHEPHRPQFHFTPEKNWRNDPNFTGTYTAPIRLNDDGEIDLHLFMDTSSIDLFINDGEQVMTSIILPKPESRGIELHVVRGTLKEADIDLWDLKSAWR